MLLLTGRKTKQHYFLKILFHFIEPIDIVEVVKKKFLFFTRFAQCKSFLWRNCGKLLQIKNPCGSRHKSRNTQILKTQTQDTRLSLYNHLHIRTIRHTSGVRSSESQDSKNMKNFLKKTKKF
jgi:hypothetical protein